MFLRAHSPHTPQSADVVLVTLAWWAVMSSWLCWSKAHQYDTKGRVAIQSMQAALLELLRQLVQSGSAAVARGTAGGDAAPTGKKTLIIGNTLGCTIDLMHWKSISKILLYYYQ